ncbi:hypothetical protein AMECASPLE_019724 [Ameca splendens]|uniref:Uncharacterized protein n=1 Tax=Ameca splendens TaxID=208324 RepID=A0ABV0XG55_9TELE
MSHQQQGLLNVEKKRVSETGELAELHTMFLLMQQESIHKLHLIRKRRRRLCKNNASTRPQVTVPCRRTKYSAVLALNHSSEPLFISGNTLPVQNHVQEPERALSRGGRTRGIRLVSH